MDGAGAEAGHGPTVEQSDGRAATEAGGGEHPGGGGEHPGGGGEHPGGGGEHPGGGGEAPGRENGTDLHDPTERTRVELALRELPDVRAARIVPGYDRDVDELHILATLDKHPKQLVRDIQSLLMARYGIATDHRVISIVQLEDDQAPEQPNRVALSRVTSAQHGLAVHVAVALANDERELLGTSEGPASATGRLRTAARATLDALKPLFGDQMIVEVEGATVERALGSDVALTLVHIHTKRGTRTISGSAVVREDEIEAIARSVLDGLNREIRLISR